MKTREQIIHDMCMTSRHDYGLDKTEEEKITDPIGGGGMTISERMMLWQEMSQIFDNCIAPYMEFKND